MCLTPTAGGVRSVRYRALVPASTILSCIPYMHDNAVDCTRAFRERQATQDSVFICLQINLAFFGVMNGVRRHPRRLLLSVECLLGGGGLFSELLA